MGVQREPWSLTSLPASLPASAVSALASYNCCTGKRVFGRWQQSSGSVLSRGGNSRRHHRETHDRTVCGHRREIERLQFGITTTDITPHTQREGALLSAHYAVAESIDLFTEVLFSHRACASPSRSADTVSQGFGGTCRGQQSLQPVREAVNVSFEYPGTGADESQSTSLIRPLIGVRGSLLSDWHYEVTAYFSRDQPHNRYGRGRGPSTDIQCALLFQPRHRAESLYEWRTGNAPALEFIDKSRRAATSTTP